MQPYKTVIYSFLMGGMWALIAQAISAIWTTILPGTPLEFFMGGATLVSMGIIGCILGGFAIYQYFEEWCTFGALLSFSGFSMAVGMKMIGPWTKDNATMGKAVWEGLWLVIWFNAVGAIVCIVFGYICGMAGVEPAVSVPPTDPKLMFPAAFFMGGLLSAIFQICFLIYKAISPKAAPVWVLMFAWMCGAILAPFGISQALINMFGQGFAVMIPIGGNNMYNVGMAFAEGEMIEGMVHLGSFLLAVCGLFLCGLSTFLIYNAKFGRKTLHTVHMEKAQHQINELKGLIPVPVYEENAGVDFDPSEFTPSGGKRTHNHHRQDD